jgi:hypothetical protein
VRNGKFYWEGEPNQILELTHDKFVYQGDVKSVVDGKIYTGIVFTLTRITQAEAEPEYYDSASEEALAAQENDLNRVWNLLTPAQRNHFRKLSEERRWIAYKDKLPIIERTEEVNKRTQIILALVSPVTQ